MDLRNINGPQSLGEFDVIVIGGGITGAGTARDCATRGLRVLLVERFDFTYGATGRNHGLMHSGARYAVTDRDNAAECMRENLILRRIARHCVEETDGLFLSLPEDDLAYQATFVDACRRAGIRADVIDPEEARRLEPCVNPLITGAVRVPDASIDPFRLTTANVVDARRHGAVIHTFHEVIGFLMSNGRIEGVTLRDNHTGAIKEARAAVTINAAGIWGTLILRKAGITLGMLPAKGALLIFGNRVNNMVINRCRMPANGDIVVPDDTICVLGTTSERVPIESIDDMRVSPAEIDLLLTEGQKLVPRLATARVLRAYAGVRPLVASDDDPTGRSISRGIVLIDHAERDGAEGLITITGGKMMTYRLMAEVATDLACKKLGKTAPCTTATTPLPGSEPEKNRKPKTGYDVGHRAAEGRHGNIFATRRDASPEDNALVCECEQVSVGEIRFAINKLRVDNILNLRRRTRVGMGACQGKLCACRAATLLCRFKGEADRNLAELAEFMNERWKGMRPVAWGNTLSEAQITATIYADLLGLDAVAPRPENDNDNASQDKKEEEGA